MGEGVPAYHPQPLPLYKTFFVSVCFCHVFVGFSFPLLFSLFFVALTFFSLYFFFLLFLALDLFLFLKVLFLIWLFLLSFRLSGRLHRTLKCILHFRGGVAKAKVHFESFFGQRVPPLKCALGKGGGPFR